MSVNTKNIIGYLIIALVLIGLFIGTGVDMGFVKAAINWGLALVLSVLIIVGVHLATE